MKRVELGITWIGVALTMIFTNLAVNVENANAADALKPNIVLILADDFGLDGVGCYGSDKHKTDPTAGGWFWKDNHLRNGKEFTDRAHAYAPDSIHQFSMDFIAKVICGLSPAAIRCRSYRC